MGRYTQDRRRGGGRDASPPPPLLITLVSLDNGSTARIIFSASVTMAANAPDSSLTIAGIGLDSMYQSGATEITVASAASPGWVSGDAWSLSGQPGWLADAITPPQSGLVS